MVIGNNSTVCASWLLVTIRLFVRHGHWQQLDCLCFMALVTTRLFVRHGYWQQPDCLCFMIIGNTRLFVLRMIFVMLVF